MDDFTPEEIARHYTSAMDSLALLDAVAADPDAYAGRSDGCRKKRGASENCGRLGFLDGRRFNGRFTLLSAAGECIMPLTKVTSWRAHHCLQPRS